MDNAMKLVRSRLRLAVSSGALILALSLGAGTARAQSFNATATPVLGAPTISTGAGTTTITIDSAETIIDWNGAAAPSATPFIFQSAGTTATFTNPVSGSPLSDYTVLNRISLTDPTSGLPVLRAVQFNGTVTSLLNGNVTGNIWFYSPTGIIAGAGSLFNVGSLVLTTDAIDTTRGLYGPGNSIRFRGTAGSTGFVNVAAGATLRTTNNKVTSQYVALVASRVVQAGTIQVDGQVALVAAEQADISINAGLLDLVVSQGTGDANGIVHTGTTTGAATSSAANKQVIQMVAMPKNTALTMLLSGNIGYTPAALASNEGSAVVLSAGYGSYVPRATQALALGNMTIADATIRNALTANATDTIKVQPTAANVVSFQADASLTAGKQIDVIADDDSLVSASGKLDLKSGFYETGGKVNVRAINTTVTNPAGQITVAGDLTIDATGASDPTASIAATSAAVSGGTVLLEAQRGSVSSAGLTVRANGQSADALTTAGNAGGGKISVLASGGGTVTAGIVDLQARGTGGNADAQGGRGTGGTIEIGDQGGALNFTNVAASTVGRGGVALAAGGNGGDGIGGAITIDIAGNTAGWSSLTADASAIAGLPLTPGSHSGNAFAQNAAISFHVGSGANFAVQGDILLDANATAGIDGIAGNTFADAGGIDVLVDGKASLLSGGARGATGNLVARANAWVDSQSFRRDLQYSPDTFGGQVSITANDGSIRLDHIYASATAEGAGAAITAGQARGGAILVGALRSGQITVDSTLVGSPTDPFGSGNLTLDVSARGAAGPNSASATAGTATLYVQDGTVRIAGRADVLATARPGSFDGLLPGPGFRADGGSASVEVRAGTGLGAMTMPSLSIDASGLAMLAATPVFGNGARGLGGLATVQIDDTGFAVGSVLVRADGHGSSSAASTGPTAFTGGAGGGGEARFRVTAGSATVADQLTLSAVGKGGGSGGTAEAGQLAANGGIGDGGLAIIDLTGGTLDLPGAATVLDARGIGGRGMDNANGIAGATGGAGAHGGGGTTSLVMTRGGAVPLLTGSDLQFDASGSGGAGGASTTGANGADGDGLGGRAEFRVSDGQFALGQVSLSADGMAGGAGALGSANGLALFDVNDLQTATYATRTLGGLIFNTRVQGVTPTSGTGRAQLRASVTSAGSGVRIANDLLFNIRARSTANASTVTVAGAPLTVNGNMTVNGSSDFTLSIAAGARLRIAGRLSASGVERFVSSGLLSADLGANIQANRAVDLTDLVSGADTSLHTDAVPGIAGGPVIVRNNLQSAGPVRAFGTAVDIVSLGALNFTQAQATTGDLLIRTAGDLAVGAVDAGGAVTLTSTGGALAATGTIAGNGVTLSAATTLGTTAIQSAGALSATSGGDMTIGGDANAGAGLSLTSSNGALTTRRLGAAQIDLASAGAMRIDGALSQGTLTARSGGLFRMRGLSSGTGIAITSADIDLGTFNLGQRGITQSITLTNGTPTARTFVGGADNQGGYTLSAAEALQLFADRQIAVNVAAGNASPADMVVGSLALTFGSNLGAGGTFKLNTAGRVTVQGAVQLRTISAADTFAIDPTQIDIVTDSGSIGLLSAGNSPLGTLSLQAGTIRVANAATLAALGSAGSLQAINTLLDSAASNPSATGYLVAGSIAFDVTQALLVQNTGLSSSFADRRGFTAGSVSIRTGGPTTQIAINGQTIDPAGIMVTGLNTVRTLSINGLVPALGGSFAPLSSVNGCVIGLDCMGVPGLRPDKNGLTRPLSPDGTGTSGSVGIIPLIAIAEQQENGSPPLIDEPITGVGNDDLWQGHCAQGQSCNSDSPGQAGNRGAN